MTDLRSRIRRLILWGVTLLAFPTHAQVYKDWAYQFDRGIGANDFLRDACLDKDGNIYITGASVGASTGYDFVTIKLNPNGEEQWRAIYNGPLSDSYDRARTIHLSESGNIYVAGLSESNRADTSYNTALLRYESDGSLTSSIQIPEDPLKGSAYLLDTDPTKNIFLLRYTTLSIGHGNVLHKYNDSGDLIWKRATPTSDMRVSADGAVYVTGYGGFHTVKYDSDGSVLWDNRYDEDPLGLAPGLGANALALASNGDVYVTGTLAFYGGPRGTTVDSDIWTVCYAETGNERWRSRFNGPHDSLDYAFDVELDGDQNAFVAGLSFYYFGNTLQVSSQLLKYDKDGNLLWRDAVKLADVSLSWWGGAEVCVTEDGSAYLLAWTGSFNSCSHDEHPGPYDALLVKYSPDGTTLWTQEHSGSGCPQLSLFTGGVDNSMVISSSVLSGGDYDCQVTKYVEDVTAPVVSIAVLQNPILLGYADIYVTCNEALSADPLLTVNGAAVAMNLLADKDGPIYMGRISGESSGQMELRTTCVDRGGNRTDTTETFISASIGPAGGTIVSDDGKFEILIPSGALPEPSWFLLSSKNNGMQRTYTVTPSALKLSCEAEIRITRVGGYEQDRSGERIGVFRQDADGQWIPLQTYCSGGGELLLAHTRILGSFQVIQSSESISGPIPIASLKPNYPNPFNPSTVIEFTLDQPSFVKLEISNILGQHVKTLVNEQYGLGHHRVVWDGTDGDGRRAASGMYFYRLQTNGHVETRKMMLIK